MRPLLGCLLLGAGAAVSSGGRVQGEETRRRSGGSLGRGGRPPPRAGEPPRPRQAAMRVAAENWGRGRGRAPSRDTGKGPSSLTARSSSQQVDSQGENREKNAMGGSKQRNAGTSTNHLGQSCREIKGSFDSKDFHRDFGGFESLEFFPI
ncbi:hypothetical protein BRADI_1g36032v3 [Brachypodium distachyon]|uniref:Uncharacterized protein n=1 Tax=Brachypodium distachyon TaxID=15368 RepID=A0A2K2DMY4_BRADI|nr:hypothetical protein BRADI_1g36032v3 [Brachypodium distachyon]